MQSVHSFVTSYLKTADTQEPAADTQVMIVTKWLQHKKQPLPQVTHKNHLWGILIKLMKHNLCLHWNLLSPQDQPTIPALQEEIEFLKSQIQDYQEEIIRVKEAYQNEFSLHVLARVASAAEKSKDNEYMCTIVVRYILRQDIR
jgi:hypothetical protein